MGTTPSSDCKFGPGSYTPRALTAIDYMDADAAFPAMLSALPQSIVTPPGRNEPLDESIDTPDLPYSYVWDSLTGRAVFFNFLMQEFSAENFMFLHDTERVCTSSHPAGMCGVVIRI